MGQVQIGHGVGSNWAGGVTNLDPNNKLSNKEYNKIIINTTATAMYNAGGEERIL